MSFFCSCPGILPQRRFTLSVHTRGLGKIISHPAGHSVVTGFRATKKPAHKCVPTSRKRIDLSPAVVASHSCNRLWNSKSKLSFTLCLLPTVQDSLEAVAFSLAYRRHCPAYCRSLNQFVKIDIPLWWQIYYQFYYIEQMFACQDCSHKLYTKNCPVR